MGKLARQVGQDALRTSGLASMCDCRQTSQQRCPEGWKEGVRTEWSRLTTGEKRTAGGADGHLEASKADGAGERDHCNVRGNQTVADERNVCRSTRWGKGGKGDEMLLARAGVVD